MQKSEGTFAISYLFSNNGYLLAGLFIDLKSKSKSYVKYPYHTFQKMVGISKYTFRHSLEKHREYKWHQNY